MENRKQNLKANRETEEGRILREKLFCCYYAKLGSICEAALRSGFSQECAMAEGIGILRKKKYRRLIHELMNESTEPSLLVRTGLERLAFGNSNDAACLVFSEEMPSAEKISALDLFNVSEMKKVKGGGVEIKFFDRIKALEKLYDYGQASDGATASSNLIEALAGMEADGEI